MANDYIIIARHRQKKMSLTVVHPPQRTATLVHLYNDSFPAGSSTLGFCQLWQEIVLPPTWDFRIFFNLSFRGNFHWKILEMELYPKGNC